MTTIEEKAQIKTASDKIGDNLISKIGSVARTQDEKTVDTIKASMGSSKLIYANSGGLKCQCGHEPKNEVKTSTVTYYLCNEHMEAYRKQKSLDLMQENNDILFVSLMPISVMFAGFLLKK